MDCGSSKMKQYVEVKIRAYNESTDLRHADKLEKQCEAGPSGTVSLFTDLLGDPLCRVRQYPAFAMLVAEAQPDKEIVGLVRAGVKEVLYAPQCGTARVSHSSEGSACKSEESTASDVDSPPLAPRHDHQPPMFVSIAYILGLRVAPKCRRLGIGAELVKKMEEWCRERGAEYVYIATEKDNEASVGLFTKKLGYAKFRNPAILVQPVYVRSKKLSKKVRVVELNKEEACKLYNNHSHFGKSEFFPKDIEDVVKSKLHRGTWLALWKNKEDDDGGSAGLMRMCRLHGVLGLGCFAARGSSDCNEEDDKGQNERRVRRFHGVLDSSGVCDANFNKYDGGIERRFHGMLDSNSNCTHGTNMGRTRYSAHCEELDEGAHVAHCDEGAHVACCNEGTHVAHHEDDERMRGFDGMLNDMGFDCTSTCHHVRSSSNRVSRFVRPSHHFSAASWAVLSLWKCNEIYQLEMKGAPLRLRGAAAASRTVGRMLSWLVSIPTMPDVFKPFGLQLIYGLHAQGPRGLRLARHLCWMAHNLAKEDGCAVVAAEVASCDPLRGIIPHWTCDEDMWCIKRLESSSDVESVDWSKSHAPPSLFLDPRDF